MPFYDRTIEAVFVISSAKKYRQGLKIINSRYFISNLHIKGYVSDISIADEFYSSQKNKPVDTHDVPLNEIKLADVRIEFISQYENHTVDVIIFTENEKEVVISGRLTQRVVEEFSDHQDSVITTQNIYLLKLPVGGFNTELYKIITQIADPTYLLINKPVDKKNIYNNGDRPNLIWSKTRLIFLDDCKDAEFYLN